MKTSSIHRIPEASGFLEKFVRTCFRSRPQAPPSPRPPPPPLLLKCIEGSTAGRVRVAHFCSFFLWIFQKQTHTLVAALLAGERSELIHKPFQINQRSSRDAACVVASKRTRLKLRWLTLGESFFWLVLLRQGEAPAIRAVGSAIPRHKQLLRQGCWPIAATLSSSCCALLYFPPKNK